MLNLQQWHFLLYYVQLLLQLTLQKVCLQVHMVVYFFEPFEWRLSSVDKLELLRP